MDLTTVKPTTVKPTTVIPRTTVPITELPKTILPTMEVLKTVVPRTKVPRVSNTPLYSTRYNRTNQQVSPFSDYNDPTQINSLADVIWDTLYRNDNLKRRDFGILSDIGDWDIPLISNLSRTVTGVADLAINTVIEPIKQGNIAAAGINTLVNLGESLDILASPVKGLILDGPEGLVKGSVGRVNYDFDTGNWLIDMLAEVVVDPFNWISFGGKAAVSGGIKSVLVSSIDDVAQAAGTKVFKETIEEASKAGLKKKLITYASRELLDSQGRLITRNIDKIADSLLRAVNRLGADYFDDAFLTAIRNKQINKMIPQYLTDLNILKGISGIVTASETLEKAMFKGAMYANFIPIDALKKIKNISLFKNYSNKIVTEVGQVVNGYLNPNELTKLANYKTVTNPKNIEYQKMKVNQILKEAGLQQLDYIDIDRAFSEKAIDAARDIRLAIEEYKVNQNFDEFLRKVANIVVPEDVVASSKDLYKDILHTLSEDITLINETMNKDGIRVFSNLSELYEEVMNNVKNIYEFNKTLNNLKRVKSEVFNKDIMLTRHQQEFIQTYKNANYKYTTAYKEMENKLNVFTDLTTELRYSKTPISAEELNKVINDFVETFTSVNNPAKITNDVNEFYKDFINRLKTCKTISEVNNLARDMFDRTVYRIKKIQEAGGLYTLLKSRTAMPLEDVQNRINIYNHKINFLKDLVQESHLDITNEQNLDRAIKQYNKILNEKTFTIPDADYSYYKDVFKAIEKFQDTLSSIPKDLNNVKSVFRDFQTKLNELVELSSNAVKYGQQLIDQKPAIKSYKNIESRLNKKIKKLDTETYSKKLTELKTKCAGGLEAFENAIEYANKQTQLYADKTGLVVGKFEKSTKSKKTVFNTRNVAIKTTDTPEGAYETFYNLFGTTTNKDGVLEIGSARVLLDEMKYTNIISESSDMVSFRNDLIKAIDELEKQVSKNAEFFKDYKNRKQLIDLIEDVQEYVVYTKQEIITNVKKLTNIKELDYESVKDLFKNTKSTAEKIISLKPQSKNANVIEALMNKGYTDAKVLKRILPKENINVLEQYSFLKKHNLLKDIKDFHTITEKKNFYLSYLEDLITQIDKASIDLNAISVISTRNKEFLAGGVGVMYAAKDENLMMLYNALSEDIGIKAEMSAFTDFDSVPYKELLRIIDDVHTEPVLKNTAQKFLNDIKQYQALDKLVERLATDSDIPDGVLRSIMSSLESFKNTQLGDLDIDRFNKELYKKINNFIYGVDSPKSLSVENLLIETDIKLQINMELKKRYLKDFTSEERKRFNKFLTEGETHISEDDTFVQEMLIRLYMPEQYIKDVITAPDGSKIFINKNGGHLYISDCETSGQRGTVNELAIKAMGSNKGIVFKVAYHDNWELPQYEVLHKMFPRADKDTAIAKYKELYNPNSLANKKAIEEGTVIFCNSEQELFENYRAYLNELNAADEVIMHNGADFDYPIITQRAIENGVYLNTAKVQLSDSLVGMKENLPLINIDSATKIKVNNYIQQYLSELPDDDISLRFLSAANYDTLSNLTELEKLLLNDLNSKAYNQTLVDAMSNLKNKYYNLLSTNEKISNSYNRFYISKEFFQTKQGQDLLQAEVKKARDQVTEMLTKNLSELQRAEYEQYLKSLNDTLELMEAGILTSNNITRMMYINRFDGDPALGFWKAIDLDTARNYMDIPNTAKLSENELKAITNFTRPLKNTYNAIRNTKPLIENKLMIANSLRNLLDSYLEIVPGAESWLKYIRINPEDYKTNYVLLQKIYNKYRIYFEKTMTDSNLVYKQLQKTINNETIYDLLFNSEKKIFTKASTEDTLFGKFKSSIQSGEFYESAQSYRDYKNTFKNIIDTGLKGLSDAIDGTIFTSAFKFKTAQQTEVLSKAVDAFTDWMDTLPELEQTKVLEKLTKSTEMMDINLAKQIFELPDEDLLNYILTNSMCLQVDSRLVNEFNPYIIKNFLERKKALQGLGLEIDYNTDLGVLTVYPNKSVGFRVEIDPVTGDSLYEINGKSVEPVKLNPIAVDEFIDYLPDNVRAGFKASQDAMNLLSNNYSTGTTYRAMDRLFYRKAYNNLPKNIKSNMLDLEYFMKDGLFNKRTRFNTTILGSQRIKSMYGDYIPNNFIKDYINSFISLASRASDKANYIEMILNKDFSINNGFINELSFDEVRKMLEDAPEFNLACLVYNKSGGIELIDLKLNTEVDFQFAKKNNAVILPYHVFANAYQIINSQTYEEMGPVLSAMTKLMHSYKRGYLMSGGMVMRNTIDTFAKNINIAKGDMRLALSKTMDAMKMYTTYNDTINAIFKFSGNQRINKEAITKFFESGLSPKMTYEEFSFIHEVLNSGALIGEVKALDNYRALSKARKAGKDVSDITDLNDMPIALLAEDLNSMRHLTNLLMDANNSIENIQRLSAYMILQEQGLNFTESIYRVSKEHFNYSMKSPREKLIELIIPFYTFKLNNLQYWAEAFADNPWIAGLFEDIMTPIWDFDDVDENELKYNRSLQHRILSGNIQLTDNGLTLKLNPSASDAFKLMTNPLGEIYNSVFAPYTFITDCAMTQIAESTGSMAVQGINNMLNIYKPAEQSTLDKIKSTINLLPYGAIAQRAITGVQYAKELNNILPALAPSIFGRTKQYEQKDFNYNNKQYKSYSKSYSKSSRKKKIYPRKTYPRRIYKRYSKPYNKSYPINFKNIYIDGMYSVPNVSTYTAKGNRYYHFSRLSHLPTVSIYDKLYTAKGKPRWDAMLQTVTPQNLKYVIKNTIHYK